jgi:hypothetical protein
MMSSISKINLTEDIVIYKSTFDWKYSKESLISKVKQNLSYIGLDDLTTSTFLIQSKELNYLKDYCRNIAIKILNKDSNDISSWAEHSWIYTSTKNTNVNQGESEMYHRHPITLTKHKKDLSNIKTDISYCFYLNVPTDLSGDDGKLMFKDKNYKEVGILPENGDIIFFNPNYLHKPNFIHSSNQERIVICSNLTINLNKDIEKETLI